MRRYSDKELHCPAEITMSMICGKWKILILRSLQKKPLRYNALGRIVPGVSQKMLSQQLREMENDGLLCRTVFPEVPPHVEYKLTDRGNSILPILNMMHSWAVESLELNYNEETQ